MLLQLKSFLRKCSLPRHKKRCPHMAVALKRWAPLRAWCRVLRGRLSVTYTNEPGQLGLATRSRFASLVLTLDESEDAISQRERLKIRDAMELVLLALRTAPHDAWEQVVRVLCWTQDFFPDNHEAAELEPRVCVRHVAYGTFQYDTVDVWAAMWTDGTRSKSYDRTRRWLLAHAQNDCVETATKTVPLTLEITPTLADMARGSTRYVERTVKMIQTLLSPRTGSRVVQLESLALDLRALDVDAKTCRALRRLQQTGIRIDSLLFSPEHPHLTRPHGGLVAMLDDTGHPIQKLVLDNSSGLAPVSVWQALRHARALTEVEIVQSTKGALPERTLVLQWQAYALLDARSPTSIERVCFTEGSLSRTDITTMNAVLASPSPSELLGEDTKDDDETTAGCVRQKRLKFLQLMTSPASDDEMSEIMQLLRYVGRDLETLAWSVDRAVLTPRYLHELFHACPQLRRLRLQRAQLPDVDGLLVQYQSGLCRRLESVMLEDSVVLDRPSLLRLLTACNDPTHAVHRTLKDFAYDNYLHENVLGEMLPLIARNQTLRHIGLRVTAFGMARHREQLRQLHLAPLARQHAPLPIDCKVAFMGATHMALPSDVCRHIFAFAGESVRRKVLCFVYDWIRMPTRFEL